MVILINFSTLLDTGLRISALLGPQRTGQTGCAVRLQHSTRRYVELVGNNLRFSGMAFFVLRPEFHRIQSLPPSLCHLAQDVRIR